MLPRVLASLHLRFVLLEVLLGKVHVEIHSFPPCRKAGPGDDAAAVSAVASESRRVLSSLFTWNLTSHHLGQPRKDLDG